MDTGQRSSKELMAWEGILKDVHGVGKDLTRKEDRAQCLESFKLQVIGSVRPPATPEEEPACKERLDQLAQVTLYVREWRYEPKR